LLVPLGPQWSGYKCWSDFKCCGVVTSGEPVLLSGERGEPESVEKTETETETENMTSNQQKKKPTRENRENRTSTRISKQKKKETTEATGKGKQNRKVSPSKITAATMVWNSETNKNVEAIELTLDGRRETKQCNQQHNKLHQQYLRFKYLVTGYDWRNKIFSGKALPEYLAKKEYWDGLFEKASKRGNYAAMRDQAKKQLYGAFPEEYKKSLVVLEKKKRKASSNRNLKPPPGVLEVDSQKVCEEEKLEEQDRKSGSENPPLIENGPQLTYPLVTEKQKTWVTEKQKTCRAGALVEGDWRCLEYNIQPLHPNLPMWAGFQIHGVPMYDTMALAVSYGSKESMMRFCKEGESINLYMDEFQAKLILLGEVSEKEQSVKPLATEAELRKKMSELSVIEKQKLEISVAEILSQLEFEMERDGIGNTAKFCNWASWKDIPENWQGFFWGHISFIRFKSKAAPPSGEHMKTVGQKQKGLCAAWNEAECAAKEAEYHSEQKIMKDKHYEHLIGAVPPFEDSTHSFYVMDQWGCEHLRQGTRKRTVERMTLAELEESGEEVYNSSFVTHGQALALANLHALAAKCVEKVLHLDKPFDYTGGSGVVRTGKSFGSQDLQSWANWPLLIPSGQEFHVDSLNALKNEMLARFYSGKLGETLSKEDAEKVCDSGFILDFPLTETGRPTKILIPGKEGERKLLARLIYTPFGSITVRSMLLMHGGHGGECGNALWHGSIFPKGSTNLFDEARLGYLRMLPEYHEEFNDYTVEWIKGTKKEPQNWMYNFGPEGKRMSERYATKLYSNFDHANNKRAKYSRWLLSPNEEKFQLRPEVLKRKAVVGAFVGADVAEHNAFAASPVANAGGEDGGGVGVPPADVSGAERASNALRALFEGGSNEESGEN
jgi:hypothetical protein